MGAYQFDCPKCGHVNYIAGTPEGLRGCIFSCDGCKEKVLMRDYVKRPDTPKLEGFE